MDELIEKLRQLSVGKAWSDADEFNPADNSGGNFDDTYEGGVKDGRIQLAREILPHLLLLQHNKAFA